MSWSPQSFLGRRNAQPIAYEDAAELARVKARLAELPPLVTSWEVERLRRLIAEAQQGKRFLLQGGDCAETLADCQPTIITNKVKILMQMALVLVHGAKRPVIRVGRLAGQYAKPRSSLTERRGEVELPSYFGDVVNRVEFTAEARKPSPQALLDAYHHAGMTLNFLRSLTGGGFADAHHPEAWDLKFMRRADLPMELRAEYEEMTHRITSALQFMEALGEHRVDELSRVEFFTSHEGLNLHYESAQTRTVPRRKGYYDLTTHMPWIGERTRQLDGAHVDFFRGINNVVGVKVGPKADPAEFVEVLKVLNPRNDYGKIIAITRMGAAHVARALPPLLEAVRAANLRVLWVTDPMHGNTQTLASGIKTRDFGDILREIELSCDVHDDVGTYFGGVHFELTGEDVTECVGGGVREQDLDRNYATLCDPRLNYRQAIQMAFYLARRLEDDKPASSRVVR